MKTRTLLAALLLCATAIALSPAASAQKDICSEPANPTMEYACTVRNATRDYAYTWVDYATGIEDCMVNQQPPAKWVPVCLGITTG